MQQLSFHYEAQALALFGSLHLFLLLCQLDNKDGITVVTGDL